MSKSLITVEKKKELARESRELENDVEYDYIAIPPDGGYAWVVLVACFFVGFTIDGFLYAFGAISDDLKKYYQCHEWTISLTISLATGCYWLTAPLVSALCNKWGCRPIGIIGSIIAAVAVAASTLAPNIYFMWLLFGLIGGIGMGFVYLPSLIMVGYYFEEKRAIAMGITTAGSGIGSIIFGPLARFLFDKFKWQGGLLILAGILLTCAFWCFLMRPLKPVQKRRTVEFSVSIQDGDFEKQAISPLLNNNGKSEMSETALARHSYEDMDRVPKTIHKWSRTNSVISKKSAHSITAEDAVRPLYKEDVFYPGDIRDLPEYVSQPDLLTYIQQVTNVPDTKQPTKMKAFWDIFLSLTNLNLLKDKKLIIICVANVWVVFGYLAPYLFIVKMAVSERNIIERNAVYLLSVIGFSNTIVRFVSGWITKIPYMSPLLVNNIGLLVAGIATLLVPLCSTYQLLLTYCMIWGGFIALHISLSSVIVCQLVGLEQYSSALGLTFMFRGMACLIAPPIMGSIRDFTLSFNVTFVIGGISLLIGSLMFFVLMWIVRREHVSVGKPQDDSVIEKNYRYIAMCRVLFYDHSTVLNHKHAKIFYKQMSLFLALQCSLFCFYLKIPGFHYLKYEIDMKLDGMMEIGRKEKYRKEGEKNIGRGNIESENIEKKNVKKATIVMSVRLIEMVKLDNASLVGSIRRICSLL